MTPAERDRVRAMANEDDGHGPGGAASVALNALAKLADRWRGRWYVDAQELADLLNAIRSAVGECRAEIARLTAELAAARAVPADVEAAIDAIECRGCGHGDPVTNADADRLKAAIARAAADRAEDLAAARWAAWRAEAGDTPTTPWEDLRDHRRESEVRIMRRALARVEAMGATATRGPLPKGG